ncbi:MAG: N-acetylmuramoyl-L-alanine amidase [Deltaproteobacteria bacterium]|nr:N-acetylmuramoyl-L-alanine amidase [Deltaproteobacteria bacterium]
MRPKIIIDPGHGGRDLGGGTNILFTEKDWNLNTSFYQLELFQKWGIPATMTRREDIYIEPTKRARIVRDSGALLCISNHVNAFDGHRSGFEIYHSIHAKPTFAQWIYEKLRRTDMKPNVNPIRIRESNDYPGRDYYFMHRLTGAVQTLIIEYGYGDNPADRQKLCDNWKTYAAAVVRGVLIYLEKAGLT